jgi:hypothetical protein
MHFGPTQPPAPTPERCLKLSDDLSQFVTRVRDGLLAAAGAAAERGDEATGRTLLDLADTASAYWHAWHAAVHEPLADVTFPHRLARQTPSPGAGETPTPPAGPARRKPGRKAKPKTLTETTR